MKSEGLNEKEPKNPQWWKKSVPSFNRIWLIACLLLMVIDVSVVSGRSYSGVCVVSLTLDHFLDPGNVAI